MTWHRARHARPSRRTILATALLIMATPITLAYASHPGGAIPVGVQTICGQRVHFNSHDIIMDGQFRGKYAVQARYLQDTNRCAKVSRTRTSTGAERAVAFAHAQVGDRYAWGGNGPDAWDCSGLVQAAWRAGGVSLPRVSTAQKASGTRIPVSQARPGDLIAYSGHVAIAIGGGRQIAATKPSTGVVNQPIWSGAQYAVRVG